MLRKYEGETAIGTQLFGTRPEALARAAQVAEQLGFNSIDLNCGCPVHKVVNKCGGAALLKDLKLLEAIIRAVVGSIKIPFSIKIRSGWSREQMNYLEVGKVAEAAGAAYICIHARTQTEFFQPEVHLEHIAELKQTLSIPVIGNGGVRSADDAINMFKQTGCDAIMLASGTLGNPFLFRQIKARLDGEPEPEISTAEKAATCLEHVRLLSERFGEYRAIKRARKLLGWYYRHIVGRSKVDAAVYQLSTLAQVEEYLGDLVNRVQEQAA